MNLQDTIVAPSTPSVVSALGVIRMSGDKAIDICAKVFFLPNKKDFISHIVANKAYYGFIKENDTVIDEVICTVFLAPNSFSGENTVEISHHGSPYIQSEIIRLLIQNGARLAEKGEFSQRAFLNGKMDLSQTEAIADLISSNNRFAHDLAMQQLRGSYRKELKDIRQNFLHIASLLELEIDFSEEHEVFVDRDQLTKELTEVKQHLKSLVDSFSMGNAFKNGVPVAIVGKPNSGKSTLMNALLKEDRSIVSDIQGTTRDTIEESITIQGLQLRFIDTAGIHNSEDTIEKQGIERSFLAIDKARIVLYIVDSSNEDYKSVNKNIELIKQKSDFKEKDLIIIVNKSDISKLSKKDTLAFEKDNAIFISAKENLGIQEITNTILKTMHTEDFSSKVMISNQRHLHALEKALEEVNTALEATEFGISSDLISENVRQATAYLGEITGEITSEDILTSIFSSFCIGK